MKNLSENPKRTNLICDSCGKMIAKKALDSIEITIKMFNGNIHIFHVHKRCSVKPIEKRITEAYELIYPFSIPKNNRLDKFIK